MKKINPLWCCLDTKCMKASFMSEFDENHCLEVECEYHRDFNIYDIDDNLTMNISGNYDVSNKKYNIKYEYDEEPMFCE